MSTRVQIKFAACPPQVSLIRQVAARLTAIADVDVHPCPVGNEAAVASLLGSTATDVVVVDPRVADGITSHLEAPVLPFEFPAGVLAARVEEALQEADSVAVLPGTGTVSPAGGRLLRRFHGAVHLLPWDTPLQLRDLVARCRRIGVQAILGGESVVALARDEGIRHLSLNDRPDETSGAIRQILLKAAAHGAFRAVKRLEERLAFGLILDRIRDGAIGPHDAALCVDHRGFIKAAYVPRAETAFLPGQLSASLTGLSLMEILTASGGSAASGIDAPAGPVALDIYPIAGEGDTRCIAVIRGTSRPIGVLGGFETGEGPDGGSIGASLKRLDAVLARVEQLASRRRAVRPRRFLTSLRRRHFLIDWQHVRCFELRSGLVYANLISGEQYATTYTIRDLVARIDPRDFFRIHRNVIVNLGYVREVERAGIGRLQLVLEGPGEKTFVVSRPASVALRKLLKY